MAFLHLAPACLQSSQADPLSHYRQFSPPLVADLHLFLGRLYKAWLNSLGSACLALLQAFLRYHSTYGK